MNKHPLTETIRWKNAHHQLGGIQYNIDVAFVQPKTVLLCMLLQFKIENTKGWKQTAQTIKKRLVDRLPVYVFGQTWSSGSHKEDYRAQLVEQNEPSRRHDWSLWKNTCDDGHDWTQLQRPGRTSADMVQIVSTARLIYDTSKPNSPRSADETRSRKWGL